jgi:hypothetical protein
MICVEGPGCHGGSRIQMPGCRCDSLLVWQQVFMADDRFKHLSDEAGGPSEAKPAPAAPFSSNCRARRSGLGNLVYCLASNPDDCPFAERHAYDNFCFHPNYEEIIARMDPRDFE